MITWAKFYFYGSCWHFQGFTAHEEAVGEFEEFCVDENVISVVLALKHPRLPDRPAPPRRRRVQRLRPPESML